MKVGHELLSLALQTGSRSVVVVGTAKNVGKTTVVRALHEAAIARRIHLGLTSIGRDGEAVDVSDGGAKPRLFIRGSVTLATARDVLPSSPACELVRCTYFQSAVGPIMIARVCHPGYYQIAGAPTARGLRGCIQALLESGCEMILVDGAVDRIAALAGGDDAVIVASGASAATTMGAAVEDLTALIARLRIPKLEDGAEYVRIDGAFTPTRAAQFMANRESRRILVRDPTQVLIRGKAFMQVNRSLRLRCERTLNVVAATVASIGVSRYFEPVDFARQVAAATSLPTFDVLSGSMQSP